MEKADHVPDHSIPAYSGHLWFHYSEVLGVSQNPNAVQERWREDVRSIGSIASGQKYGVIEVHHCRGRSAKSNKVEIGHEFINPLTPGEHLMIAGTNDDRMGLKQIIANRYSCSILDNDIEWIGLNTEFDDLSRLQMEKLMFHWVMTEAKSRGFVLPEQRKVTAIMEYTI